MSVICFLSNVLVGHEESVCCMNALVGFSWCFSVFVYPEPVKCVCIYKPAPFATLYQCLNGCALVLINGKKAKDTPDSMISLQYVKL